MNRWYVFYMDNDGRKQIVEQDLSYSVAVKKAQQLTTLNNISYEYGYKPLPK